MYRQVVLGLLAATFATGLAQGATRSAEASAGSREVAHAGAVPINGSHPHTRAELATTPSGAGPLTAGPLASGGGAVLTQPRLFLSYWGPEWAAGFSTGGYTSRQAQTYLESFFSGVGGSGWMASNSQYCSGAAAGATSCPGGGGIGNPAGQLAGVWIDASPVPASPVASEIAAAAARAGAHFGNQPGAVYTVLSPSGKSEAGFGSQWCAWHGSTNSAGVQLAYAYIPYQPDAGSACGVDYINSNDATGHGYFDGFSIVAGHEYAEAVTDPFPGSGWVDPQGNENGDKCAWALAQSANTTLSTGTFAVQPLWSNAANSCVLTSPLTPPANPPPVYPPPAPAPAPPPQSFNSGAFNPIAPARILDTRTGLGAPVGGLGSGQVMSLQVAGQGGVPADASSVTINITATSPSSAGYLTVWPAGAARPTASNLNFTAGQTVANLVQVPLGSGGRISIFNAAGWVDVVGDVNGYTSGTGNSFTALVPQRVLDTRTGNLTLAPGQTLDLAVGAPAGAVAAVLNLTAASPSAAGYLTAWPAGMPRPTASNLNFVSAQTVANRAVVQLSSGGAISIYNFSGSTDVVVDLGGYYSSAAMTTGSGTAPTFTGLSPTRLLDTRLGQSRLSPGQVLPLTVAGTGPVPAGARAAVLNVTATGGSGPGYLTVWPAGSPRPTASDVNWGTGQTVPNLVFAAIGTGGVVDLYNAMGTTDLVVDLLGYYS